MLIDEGSDRVPRHRPGRVGAGKTFALRKTLEGTYGHMQHIVLDVEYELFTLRERFAAMRVMLRCTKRRPTEFILAAAIKNPDELND